MRKPNVVGMTWLAALFAACGGDDGGSTTVTPDGGTPKGESCRVASDCASKSPTVQCNAGICEDRLWGCIKQPDDRPAATMQTATLKVGFADYANQPVTTPAAARACPLTGDAACTQPLAGATAVYTPGTGFVVTGVAQNQPFRLKVDPPTNPKDFLGIDFYSQRPARDVTEEKAPLSVFTEGLVTGLSAAFGLPVRADAGMLLVVYHDCEGNWPDGVVASIPAGDAAADSRFIYFTTENLPDVNRTETSLAGFVVGINLPTNKPLAVSSKARGMALPDYTVTLLPGRLTIVHAYPRTY